MILAGIDAAVLESIWKVRKGGFYMSSELECQVPGAVLKVTVEPGDVAQGHSSYLLS